MSEIYLGNLPIGKIPRVIGTISKNRTLLQLNSIVWPHCDIVEVRLDEIDCSVENCLNNLQSIEKRGLPIILTLRPVFEGGKWDSTEEERSSIFTKALKYVSAIDIEFKSKLVPEICEKARKHKKITVVSFHDFKKTPKLKELKDIIQKITSYDNVIAKISTMVNSSTDFDTLRKLLDYNWKIPVCIIGMGSKGTMTRTLFPALGSCFTYGYLDTPSAPGQLPCRMLTEQLRQTFPEFNEDVIIRYELLECA